MSTAQRDIVLSNEQYLELIVAVDSYLAANFAKVSRDRRRDIRQQAFLNFEVARASEPVLNPEAFLIRCARNRATDSERDSDRRRRRSFDPLDAPELRIPDPGAGPDELAIQADEDRRVRVLIEQLDQQERAVIKLRLDDELAPKEIAGRLGLSVSRAHALLKHAGHALVDAISASELGEFSRRQRSLLAAVVMGIATERQQRVAGELLKDPQARAVLEELRGLGQKTAAAIPPVPVVAAEHSSGRLSELAAHAKAQIADGLGAAKQHATAAYLRAGDPTPLAGARPGTVAATVASCLAIGGGAYCAVDGIPNQLGQPLGLHEPAKPEAKAKTPERPKAPIAPAAPSPTAQPTPVAPKPTSPPAATAPAAPPEPAGSPAQRQFGFEQPSPTPTQPQPAAPSPGSSGGGAGQFGFER